ncbi:MAG: DUF2934 domain-containing protein [Phycisphaeraceae bacterium]|nr:DUF2934 domain-containing protein [Phycisphaeraceae bacterium]
MRTRRKAREAAVEKAVAQTEPKTPPNGAEREAVIRQRAYEIYRQRVGRPERADGDAVSDWLLAEREVLGREGA